MKRAPKQGMASRPTEKTFSWYFAAAKRCLLTKVPMKGSMFDLLNILFSPKGRLNRTRYLIGFLALFTIIGMIFSIESFLSNNDAELSRTLLCCLCIPLVWACLVTDIKRFRDFDKSGWYCLFLYVPYVGFIIMIVLFFIPGTPGKNKFGEPDQKQRCIPGKELFIRNMNNFAPNEVLALLKKHNKVAEVVYAALRWAAKNGHQEVVKELLTYDAVKDNTTADDNEALYLAAEYGHLEVVKELLTYDAIKNNIAADDNDALRWAAKNGHLEVVNELLTYDAVKDNIIARSNGALRLAAKNGHLEIVKILLTYDAVIDNIIANDNEAQGFGFTDILACLAITTVADIVL